MWGSHTMRLGIEILARMVGLLDVDMKDTLNHDK